MARADALSKVLHSSDRILSKADADMKPKAAPEIEVVDESGQVVSEDKTKKPKSKTQTLLKKKKEMLDRMNKKSEWELLGRVKPGIRNKERELVKIATRGVVNTVEKHQKSKHKKLGKGNFMDVLKDYSKKDKVEQKRHKYFDDSSKYSLNQMFEREKLTTTEDNIEMYMEVSAQCDDSLEDNETSDISKKAIQKMGHTNQEEKDIKKAIHQHQKLNLALEKCQYCLDQPNMKQHLIVTIQEQVFVCIPNFQTLTEGHCLIVPKRHVPSFLALDEDEWNGFQEALSSVRRLFRARGKSVLCMETSLNFGRCPHAYAECIPVPEEEGDLAPLYFKKSILESEEEWTHNVKLVDLTKKGLRRSIPKNLPYFAIFFDPAVHGGYAHVIEDEKAFPRNFGKEVVGGMLDIDYNYLYKNRREDPMKKSKEAAEFTKMWELFHGE